MAEMPERDAAFLLDMLLAARDALSFVEGLDDRRGGAAEIWAIPGPQNDSAVNRANSIRALLIPARTRE